MCIYRQHFIPCTSRPLTPATMSATKGTLGDLGVLILFSRPLASELAVLPVHHHDALDQCRHALLELHMCGVLVDIVVAVLAAGKLNHLCPAHKSAQAIGCIQGAV